MFDEVVRRTNYSANFWATYGM